jgi:hypothetical protein
MDGLQTLRNRALFIACGKDEKDEKAVDRSIDGCSQINGGLGCMSPAQILRQGPDPTDSRVCNTESQC